MSVQAFYRFGGFVQFLQSLDRPFIDLAYDHIVENLSIVLMCRNCKVTYKVKLLAYDMKCSLDEAFGYVRQSAQVST